MTDQGSQLKQSGSRMYAFNHSKQQQLKNTTLAEFKQQMQMKNLKKMMCKK